ncbi:hypothetical protein MMC34_008010 [Xylographa carneopallida]|nr:hypothetical protein [Xylographa carneopallida]
MEIDDRIPAAFEITFSDEFGQPDHPDNEDSTNEDEEDKERRGKKAEKKQLEQSVKQKLAEVSGEAANGVRQFSGDLYNKNCIIHPTNPAESGRIVTSGSL